MIVFAPCRFAAVTVGFDVWVAFLAGRFLFVHFLIFALGRVVIQVLAIGLVPIVSFLFHDDMF